jgi:hypothetical protein
LNCNDKYHGVRYPTRSIRPPICKVTVIREDGRIEPLLPRIDIKSFVDGNKWDAETKAFFEYAWGAEKLTCDVLVEDPDDGTFEIQRRASDMRNHRQRSQQLALALLASMFDHEEAKRQYDWFHRHVIGDLPEMEWLLTGEQLLAIADSNAVLSSLGKIGESK